MFNKDTKYLILITIIFIAACVETDIYLPAFPDMMIFFHTSEKAIQSLLTWNFFGICISGPFYGPISDSFGRRKPLLAALTFFFIGSVITIFANSFESMLIGRLLQGLGSGGCFTLGTAIIFDAFQKEKAVTAISQLNTIIPLIMAMAPMAGGYLNLAYGFRSNFIAIGIFVLISLFMSMLYFDESLPKEKRQEFKLKKIFLDFKLALTNLALWQVITIISLLFGAYMAFVSATAVLFVVEMGVSRSAFPLFQAAILGAYVLASISCSKAVAKFGLKTVKKTGAS